MYQSLAGSSIYSLGRAPQRTTTTGSTPIVCMVLFQVSGKLSAHNLWDGNLLLFCNKIVIGPLLH